MVTSKQTWVWVHQGSCRCQKKKILEFSKIRTINLSLVSRPRPRVSHFSKECRNPDELRSMWKERVTSVSDRIFPGLANYSFNDYDAYMNKGNEVLSNLPLQVALYFNIVFFPFWLLVTFVLLPLKYEVLPALYQYILMLMLGTVIIVEVVRLYMGYIGNLKEQIPEMAGFWLLTILLQAPLQLFFLMCSGFQPTILEKIMQTIMCLFVVLELVFGFVALRRSAKHSVQSFHLASFQSSPKAK